MPFAVTSCAFKIHGASGPARGKPVLISILLSSLVFHAVTPKRSSFRENSTSFDHYPTLNTDRQTDTTTVTFTAHAR